MKVKMVIASGVHAGREIPIAGQQFIIGRDPSCQLRPASPAISKKHCGIIIRGEKVFLKDFGSTNGTIVDGQPLSDEMEVTKPVSVQAGPLDFQLIVEAPAKVPVAAVAAKPAGKQKSLEDSDEDFAAFLLEGDEGPTGIAAVEVPPGSTVAEMGASKQDDTAEAKPDTKKTPVADADTRSAAADILRKYQRRPRT